MAWSKRKPYHHLKLSMKEFFTKPVRYLKEFYGKESVLDKPYQTGRPEMHHDVPEYPGFLPWIRPRLPEIPGFQKFPPLPPIPDFPPLELPEFRFEQPEVASPWTRPEEPMGTPFRKRPGEPAVNPPPGIVWAPQCNIQGYIDCLDTGDVGYFNAASTRKDAAWGIEVSDPGLVRAEIIRLNSDGLPKSGSLAGMIKIKVTGLADPDVEQIVTVCVFMATYRITGTRSVPYPRGSGYATTNTKKIPIRKLQTADCGCINITVPCECGGTADPLTWETAGETLARGTAPCASSGSTLALTVAGGTKPYSWSVTGTGFCLDSAITVGLGNTLRADNTACGSATITVTDKCAQTVTGYVREPDNSHWEFNAGLEHVCLFSGVGAVWTSAGSATKQDGTVIQGNQKSVIRVLGAGASSGSTCPDEMTCATPKWPGNVSCPDYSSGVSCNSPYGTAECQTGYSPAGYTQAGSWLCWGRDNADCGDDTWEVMWCGCVTRIWNYDWICD